MGSSVGDIRNNMKILQNEIRHIKYPDEVDYVEISKGMPQAYLPLYHYAFSTYSPVFADEIIHLLDDTLYSKSDLRFMESVYRVLRDLFRYKPSITKEQFFSAGNFAERKVMMCTDILRLVRDRVRLLEPQKPTNPNIKVSSVIDNRRNSKLGSRVHLSENVSAEPSLDNSLVRKTSRTSSLQGSSPVQNQPAENYSEETVCKVTGYVRPKSGRGLAQVEAQSPDSSMDFFPFRTDHSDAMETILAKVRDLPSQLSNFMQAVENRLYYMQEKLQECETVIKELKTHEMEREMKKKAEEDPMQLVDSLRSRLLLLENRVKLLESKNKVCQAPADEKKHSANPFVSLEKGGGYQGDQIQMDSSMFSEFQRSNSNSFASTTIKDFSPIRRENLFFADDTVSSTPDTHSRRSSTPNHSVHAVVNGRPTCTLGEEQGGKQETSWIVTH
ncbi:hypothetical protein C0Q70_06371 [Pomacea canaliculata]|uniref:Centrosomal protein of 44 kDa n=1 Tax=Pomacea canaliculata TaxID=400727 RepID=A0A2T7PNW0_POMCA|nr:hypothetical protein C0Q70_06371 [Pomacea canaliculata]